MNCVLCSKDCSRRHLSIYHLLPFFLIGSLWKHFSSRDYTCSNPKQTVWESPGYFNRNKRALESYYFGSIIFIIPSKRLESVHQEGVCGSFDCGKERNLKHIADLAFLALNHFQKLHDLTSTLRLFRFTEYLRPLSDSSM